MPLSECRKEGHPRRLENPQNGRAGRESAFLARFGEDARDPRARNGRARSHRRIDGSGRHCLCRAHRSEEHTSELQSLLRISYAVICLKKKIDHQLKHTIKIPTRTTDTTT